VQQSSDRGVGQGSEAFYCVVDVEIAQFVHGHCLRLHHERFPGGPGMLAEARALRQMDAGISLVAHRVAHWAANLAVHRLVKERA
jgi:hypothetical protein